MARILKLDMTNVESFSKCTEGRHTVKAVNFENATTANGDDMVKVTLEVTKGNDKGCRLFDNFVLTDKALWKFKQYLVAVGVKASGKIAVDLDKLINKVCDVDVFHEEYNGVERAKVGEYMKPEVVQLDEMSDYDDFDDDEEEVVEEKPVKAKAKGKAKKAEPEPEPEDDDDFDFDDEDDEEEEIVPPPKTKAKAKAKPAPKKEVVEEDDDDDDDDWEDWEDA